MKRTERGFTLVEIMIVVAIIALLAAIAIPNVLRGRTTANESAAIGNLRALVSSLEMYRSVNNLYPAPVASWATQMFPAGVPAFGPPSFNTASLSASTIQGFNYTYAPNPAAGPANAYTLLAVPQTLNTTGTRSFVADQTGIIRHCTGTGTAANMTDGTPAPTIDATVTACD